MFKLSGLQESKALFHILDDGDGTVTLKEFIDGNLEQNNVFGVNHCGVNIYQDEF